MKLGKLAFVAAVASLIAAPLSAHTWNIGWKSVGGGLTFYGVSWHGGGIGGSVDDFVANPAGITLNGVDFVFDAGSTVNLNDTNTAGGVTNTGGLVPGWDALGLDGAIASSSYPSSTYGKYSSVFLDAADLANIGIGQGANSVTLAPFAPNVHWWHTPFSSATVPINIIVTPPSGNVVPLPAAMPLMAAGMGIFGFLGWRRRKTA